jgi:hypothetical protein
VDVLTAKLAATVGSPDNAATAPRTATAPPSSVVVRRPGCADA